MKIRKALLISVATAASLTAVAVRADGFSGAYLGAYMGKVEAEDKLDLPLLSGQRAFTAEVSPEQTQYGLVGGYNWSFDNNLLLGVEADYEGRSDGSDSSYFTDPFGGGIDPTDVAKTELKSAASLRGRAGYIFNNQALFYVTAGYAAVEAKRTYTEYLQPQDQDQPWIEASESSTVWQDGWTAGAGVEYLVNANFAARFEYRYADYGTEELHINRLENSNVRQPKQDLTEKSLRLGASYQF